MTDYEEVLEILDDWFEDGEFGPLSQVPTVVRMLRRRHPEFELSVVGATRIVEQWRDCARELGELD